MEEQVRKAIIDVSSCLDPCRQGVQWPDPITWDGRSLPEQASDILRLADSVIDQTYGETDQELIEATERLRQRLDRVNLTQSQAI